MVSQVLGANGMLFVETSAANEENVALAFQSLLKGM